MKHYQFYLRESVGLYNLIFGNTLTDSQRDRIQVKVLKLYLQELPRY